MSVDAPGSHSSPASPQHPPAARPPGHATDAAGTHAAAATAGTYATAAEPAPPESALRRALARARDGKALDQAEAATLLHARGEHLPRLLAYASRSRDAGLEAAGRPGVITYSRKVFVPLTRLCRDRCGYC